MEEKIEVFYTKENTHVVNSYLIKTRKAIREEVETIIFVREARMYPIRSTKGSYINEWKAHNRLYQLGLFTSHTKDVDFEEPENAFMRLIYFIIGGII